MIVEFEAQLWRWEARRDDGWVFVSLPAEASDEIRDLTDGQRRGFGSVRVKVRIGTSTWRTSIFPNGKLGTYALPIKKGVRTAQHIDAGDSAKVVVELVDF
nr:DUF1905 domain-containing protein [uncultured Actinoplanes sp.]